MAIVNLPVIVVYYREGGTLGKDLSIYANCYSESFLSPNKVSIVYFMFKCFYVIILNVWISNYVIVWLFDCLILV